MPKMSNQNTMRMRHSIGEIKREMFENIDVLREVVGDVDIIHSIISKIDYYAKIKWTFGCLPNGFLDEYTLMLDKNVDKWILRDIIQTIGKSYFILTENEVYFNIRMYDKVHPE